MYIDNWIVAKISKCFVNIYDRDVYGVCIYTCTCRWNEYYNIFSRRKTQNDIFSKNIFSGFDFNSMYIMESENDRWLSISGIVYCRDEDNNTKSYYWLFPEVQKTVLLVLRIVTILIIFIILCYSENLIILLLFIFKKKFRTTTV